MTFGTLPGAEAAVDLATAVSFEEIQRYFAQIKIQEQNLRLALDAGQTINPPRVGQVENRGHERGLEAFKKLARCRRVLTCFYPWFGHTA
jgi:hypothetical protein